ncbi:hypothetical protein TRSC58_07711 [Trypanosoma rangeli SC58]|uniref:Uncharacterized protein n=1 Tax=Trypanosoma rangeli SC58 TaxID=429131 RepID=A0A061ISD0_TRYRA|nr:hypothetical protein TRSC58_07711 [Trypanosoma rangeli SC58]
MLFCFSWTCPSVFSILLRRRSGTKRNKQKKKKKESDTHKSAEKQSPIATHTHLHTEEENNRGPYMHVLLRALRLCIRKCYQVI